MSQREKNNNTVGQFVEKCNNSMFVIFILLVKILNLFNLLLSTRKSVAEKKKDICHLNVYVKYEQNRWLRHCKIQSLFMKPNNLTSLRRMSRVRFACHGFLRSKLTILQSQLKNPHLAKLHPYSALSLMEKSLGKTLPCRPHFTQIRF